MLNDLLQEQPVLFFIIILVPALILYVGIQYFFLGRKAI